MVNRHWSAWRTTSKKSMLELWQEGESELYDLTRELQVAYSPAYRSSFFRPDAKGRVLRGAASLLINGNERRCLDEGGT